MKSVIVSGYFNPLHTGHLDMIEAAADMGDKLVVIVNNDKQQIAKKGKVILNENDRLRIVSALESVDEALIALDDDGTVIRSLEEIAKQHDGDELVFANGGDRDSAKVVPELEVCNRLNIKMIYGVGGKNKADSSTRINQAMGHDR